MSGRCNAGSGGPSRCYAGPGHAANAGPGHAANAGPGDATTASCGGPCGDGTDDDGWSASGGS